MSPFKLYMMVLGATPPGRFTEQHDIFFGIGRELKDLIPSIYSFWPEAGPKIHIDAWREVTQVDGFSVKIIQRGEVLINSPRLFFINLGGYKENEFEEYHYKMIVAATDKGEAIQSAKATAFYKHTGFEGANSHIDDKYGVDVDDLYEISDILPPDIKEKFSIQLSPADRIIQDEIHLGYFKLDKIMNSE